MTLADIIAYGRRYLTVGALWAVVYNLTMIGCDFAGVHYLPASLLSIADNRTVRLFPALPLHIPKNAFTRWLSALHGRNRGRLSAPARPDDALFCSGLGLGVPIATPLATGVLFVFNYLSAHWAIVRRLRQN